MMVINFLVISVLAIIVWEIKEISFSCYEESKLNKRAMMALKIGLPVNDWYDLLFFWVFGEIDEVVDSQDLDRLHSTFTRNFERISRGIQPENLILGYRKVAIKRYEEDPPILLARTGMI